MFTLAPEALDKIRKKHSITSDEKLAAKIGVTTGTIRNLRRGGSPSLETVVKLAVLAGRPVEDLIVEREETAVA